MAAIRTKKKVVKKTKPVMVTIGTFNGSSLIEVEVDKEMSIQDAFSAGGINLSEFTEENEGVICTVSEEGIDPSRKVKAGETYIVSSNFENGR